MEETEGKIVAMVKAPTREVSLRETKRGFSLGEIKAAEKDVYSLKKLGILIDYRRRSKYDANIELLKNIEIPERKDKKREPFVKKEKKIRVRTKKEKAPKKIEEKDIKKAKKPVKKETKGEKKTKQVKVEAKDLGIKLTELAGLGPATVKKLMAVGVSNVEELCKEDPKELAMLVPGCSEERLSGWVSEGKELLEKK